VSGIGVFGRVRAYVGLVETQGRGSLHLHMLLWLQGAPGPEHLQQLFQSDSFRWQVQDFIKVNFSAHLEGVTTHQYLEMIPTETDVAYSRPPNPQSDHYTEDLESLE